MLLNVFCFKWSLHGQETSIHTWIFMFTVTSHLGMAKNRQNCIKKSIPEQCHKNFCKQNVFFRFVFDKTVHLKFSTLAFQHGWPFCEKCHWCPFLETWPYIHSWTCDLVSFFTFQWKALDVFCFKCSLHGQELSHQPCFQNRGPGKGRLWMPEMMGVNDSYFENVFDFTWHVCCVVFIIFQ